VSLTRSAIFFAIIMIVNSVLVPVLDNIVSEKVEIVTEENPWTLKQAFNGFHASTGSDIWNQTPWQNIAMPSGFDLLTVIDYSDVGVLINNNSEASKTIGWAFVNARNISTDRIFIFNDSDTPTAETINREQFDTYFMLPFFEMLNNRSLGNTLNYLVTTKGIPLRINGGNDKASFDQEFSLLGGQYNGSIGGDFWVNHQYGPLAGKEMEVFTRQEYGFYLVTRLTGYTVETALGLIEKANNSLGQRGTFVLDLATNRNDSGYKYWNDDLYTANTTLNGTLGLPVIFDEETEFITNISNVMGYASWGSNDGNWNLNYLPNGGFDTADDSWSSGSRYWNASSPTVSTGDEFNWGYQNSTKQGGNGALEAQISTECSQESGDLLPGIYAEYFDNEGISFNSATMPDLIDRVPDHIRTETSLAYSSSGNPYVGLDERFNTNWGARFSGLIEIPEAGNWTMYLNSDDGSELWIDGVSAIQNYAMHGMREYSVVMNLSAGPHDFRVEFFQGGGPHGLILSWEGPNVSKATIPPSAFYVAGDYTPQSENLIHHWNFEEGSGNQTNDSASNGTDFSLYGMDSSNWRNCIDGNCLWYDGTDDYAKVNVDDWLGNFTVSQWVWANFSNQTTYAATFAIDDNAGSNQSFQHMISSNQWNLHNNQSNVFGDVTPQHWTHLVTVYDAGDTRQYMDGVLVNSNVFPNGSINNFDLYKLGVNRAGSSYFEGMIDNLMIWNTSLSNGSVTTLNRDIVNNCSAYSGNGQGVAYLETTYEIPSNFTNHAWSVYGYGKRTGDVFGQYNIEVSSLDTNGTVININTSSNKVFTTNWNSASMRFRPHQDATSLRIKISLDIVPTSTDGSLFIDSTVLRVIRPHMTWVNGSIVETAVSTGGRSFNWGTTYGQSLVADILEDGASGIKGYVYEPYLTAVGYPSVLLPSYAMGYNLAESQAAANRLTSWMGVVVGDPKMAAYADIFHDVSILDARKMNNASLNEMAIIQIAVENRGMSEANGTLVIQDVQGNKILSTYNLSMPKGDEVGSRILLNLTYYPENTGWTDIRIIYQNISSNYPERNTLNNMKQLRVWVNAAPVIDAISCDSTVYSRGDNFICTVTASDDVNVTSVEIRWLVIGEGITHETGYWVSQNPGRVDQNRWQTSIILSTGSNLGYLALQAFAEDESGQITTLIEYNISQVVNASAMWFGPHVGGVDDSQWVGATPLPNHPAQGIFRGENITLRSCVLDADLFVESETPTIQVSSGTVSNLTSVSQSDANHHCYVGNYSLQISQPLTDLTFYLYSFDGQLLNSRQIEVFDREPEIDISVVDSEGETLSRVLGGGGEFVKIVITDADDPLSPIIGDLDITWPGAETLTYPIDILQGDNTMLVELPVVEVPLESGDLIVYSSITGKHGASQSKQFQIPLILTLPDIVEYSICDSSGPIEELMFGQTATLTLVVESKRPIQSITASLYQENWVVSAPLIDQPVWTQPNEDCLNSSTEGEVIYFRVKLDSSFTDDGGTLTFTVKNIDGLSNSDQLSLEFIHAPPVVMIVADTEVAAGEDLHVNGSVNDADGLSDVTCFYYVVKDNQSLAIIQSLFLGYPLDNYGDELVYPVPLGLANQSINVSYSCADSNSGYDNVTIEINILPPLPCLNCSDEIQSNQNQSDSEEKPLTLYLVILIIISIIISLLLYFNKGKDTANEEIDWSALNENQQSEKLVVEIPDSEIDELFEGQSGDEDILNQLQENVLELPDGWTVEKYSEWLKGSMPEGWVEDQWQHYSREKLAIIEEQQLL
jgi:uncharacterized protein (TIGR03790 family)